MGKVISFEVKKADSRSGLYVRSVRLVLVFTFSKIGASKKGTAFTQGLQELVHVAVIFTLKFFFFLKDVFTLDTNCSNKVTAAIVLGLGKKG